VRTATSGEKPPSGEVDLLPAAGSPGTLTYIIAAKATHKSEIRWGSRSIDSWVSLVVHMVGSGFLRLTGIHPKQDINGAIAEDARR
jgi:hypothetical protein